MRNKKGTNSSVEDDFTLSLSLLNEGVHADSLQPENKRQPQIELSTISQRCTRKDEGSVLLSNSSLLSRNIDYDKPLSGTERDTTHHDQIRLQHAVPTAQKDAVLISQILAGVSAKVR